MFLILKCLKSVFLNVRDDGSLPSTARMWKLNEHFHNLLCFAFFIESKDRHCELGETRFKVTQFCSVSILPKRQTLNVVIDKPGQSFVKKHHWSMFSLQCLS